MIRLVGAYAAVVIVVAALDMLWLGVIAKATYQSALGHLLAARPNFLAAVLFYFVYSLGLMVFAITPHALDQAWRGTIIAAALFGFVAYATYDLTNLATLRDWPIGLSILDMIWGVVISVIAGTVGKLVFSRLDA